MKDIEILIINDGSTDNSNQIIEDLKSHDKRIRVINKNNSGIIDSLNVGIENSDSEFIARMDSDDISQPNRFDLQIERFKNNSNLIACGGNVKVFGSKTIYSNYPTSDIDCKSYLLFSPCFAHPTTMIRRNILERNKIRYQKGYELAEDYKIWSDLSEYGDFENIKEVILQYRLHKNQTTSLKKEPQQLMHAKISHDNLKKIGLEIDLEEVTNLIFPSKSSSKYKTLISIKRMRESLYQKNYLTNYTKNYLTKRAIEAIIPLKRS